MNRIARLARSVRVRITVAATAIVLVALVASGFALVTLQRRALTENIDTAIRLRADDIQLLLAAGSLPQTVAVADDEAAVVQLVASDGRVVAESENMAGSPPILPDRPAVGATVIRQVPELPVDNEAFRVLVRTIETPQGSLTLLVAGSLDQVHESTDSLAAILRVGIPLLSVVVAGGSWLVVGRALSPVEAIRREVATITATGLSRRVPEPPPGDEIGKLARTMNAMLGRLEESRARQDRFVADAAHELRSPLASMRTQIDVDLEHPQSSDPRATLTGLRAETTRLQRLVDDLLLLARSDAGQLAHGVESVDLDDILLAEATRLRSTAGVTLDTSSVSAAQVQGDPDQLLRATRNLVENAARYARSTVWISLHEEDGMAVLSVSDDGEGVPGDDRERIFERFTRLDSGRGRGEGGTGLGLAITRAIAEGHGGTVTVDSATGGGARFVLRVPASPSSVGPLPASVRPVHGHGAGAR